MPYCWFEMLFLKCHIAISSFKSWTRGHLFHAALYLWLAPSLKVLPKWFTYIHMEQTLYKSFTCTSHNSYLLDCNFCENKDLVLNLYVFPKLLSKVLYMHLGFNEYLNNWTLNKMSGFLTNWFSLADHLFTSEQLLVLLL